MTYSQHFTLYIVSIFFCVTWAIYLFHVNNQGPTAISPANLILTSHLLYDTQYKKHEKQSLTLIIWLVYLSVFSTNYLSMFASSQLAFCSFYSNSARPVFLYLSWLTCLGGVFSTKNKYWVSSMKLLPVLMIQKIDRADFVWIKGIVKWQGRRGVSGISRIIMTSHTIADVF